ncbi:MAG: PQQ-like beta-propeller repeat protein [Verrucomicrobiales bacterium]|nr:PQQ-like beta-propeller repeat protein [Verrucomicrobiales bacterium]
MNAWTRGMGTALFLLGILNTVRSADWPQFLGPDRNGSTPEGVGVPWSPEGPPRQWRVEAGMGFAGPVVAEGRAVLFHRIGDDDVLTVVDAATGRRIWEQRQATSFVDDMGSGDGPRGTPAVSGGRVFTLGADGRLSCHSLSDGQRLWSLPAREQFQADPGFFGFGCSPLVIDGRVLINIGGRPGAGLVAVEADSGRVAWKLRDDEAGYASPVPVMETLNGARTVLFFNREGLVGVQGRDGVELFNFPWRSRISASVNAASPVVSGNEVFLTASYGTGAVLLRRRGGKLETVWSGDDSLSAHFATPVLRSGFLYGFHGRQERGAELRCVDWATGKVRWRAEGVGPGSVVLSADRLVVLLESGELLVVRAEPDAYSPIARAQILGRAARAPLAIAGGTLFARDSRQWIAVRIGGGAR